QKNAFVLVRDFMKKYFFKGVPLNPEFGGEETSQSPKPDVFSPPNHLQRYALAAVSSLGTA
ncbi:MAG: hypothetical protein II957_04830, partial [Treponema sp.]|nr:hypothetical protein [Treponema sp.]